MKTAGENSVDYNVCRHNSCEKVFGSAVKVCFGRKPKNVEANYKANEVAGSFLCERKSLVAA